MIPKLFSTEKPKTIVARPILGFDNEGQTGIEHSDRGLVCGANLHFKGTTPPEAFVFKEVTIQLVPPAALPGAKRMKSLINRF